MAAPDYRIDGFAPASNRVEDDFHWITLGDDTYAGLAAHHTADGRHSFLLLYDGAAIWDLPGTAEYLGMHVERDLSTRTFTFDAAPAGPPSPSPSTGSSSEAARLRRWSRTAR